MEAADSHSCDVEQTEFFQLDDDDVYIATLQREGGWDEDIDVELSKLISMRDIRVCAASSRQSSDVQNPACPSETASVADAMRKAN